jgi:hypothetical protein
MFVKALGRLNRGGERAANRALHMINIRRNRRDQAIRSYGARRRAEGYTEMEIMRGVKRYVSRNPIRGALNRTLTNKEASTIPRPGGPAHLVRAVTNLLRPEEPRGR